MGKEEGRSELLMTSLRKAGMRVTRPRLLVLQALTRFPSPATHAEVATALDGLSRRSAGTLSLAGRPEKERYRGRSTKYQDNTKSPQRPAHSSPP